MRRPTAARIFVPFVVLFLPACNQATHGGGSPVEPAHVPSITSIEPADAAPGEPVTIRGENLAGGVTAVTFDAASSQVISATDIEIETVVPDVAEGDRSIVVSVDGTRSPPFHYRVASAPAPAIAAIQPARAHPGERIVILGSNLSGRSPVNVHIAGVGASVESTGPARIVAFVPVVAVGVANVQVTVGAKISNVLTLEILRALPTIYSVVPNPTRAGLWVTIRGAYLVGSEVAVLVDGISTEVRRSSDMSELGVRIPTVATGTHSLQVGVDGDFSAPFEFDVDQFDVSGLYDVKAVIVKRVDGLSQCGFLPGMGTSWDTQLELVDRRPDLVATLASGTRQYPGTVDSGGTITAPPGSIFGPATGIGGRVTRRPNDGRPVVDATIANVIDLLCYYEVRVTGLRRDPQNPPG